MHYKNGAGVWVPFAWCSAFPEDSDRASVRLLALMILSDIVWWHAPKADGSKKYHADLLQKSYGDYVDAFGESRFRVKKAFDYLEGLRVIRRVFRSFSVKRRGLANVMFIELHEQRLQQILEGGIPCLSEGWSSAQARDGLSLKQGTYTEGVLQNELTEEVPCEKNPSHETPMKPMKKGTTRMSADQVHEEYLKTVQTVNIPAKKKPLSWDAVLLWQKVVPLHFEVHGILMLTKKEQGQLGRALKSLGSDGLPVIKWAIEHWSAFTARARHDKGLKDAPKVPHAGFFLSHCGIAKTMHWQSEQKKPIAKKSPVNLSSKPGEPLAEKVQESAADEPLTAEEFLKITGFKPGGGSK